MGFFRRKSGVLVLLLCLALLAAAAWYCLGGEGWKKTPQGTLVFHGSQQSAPAAFTPQKAVKRASDAFHRMGLERKTEWIPIPLPQRLPEQVPCAAEETGLPCMEVSA